MNLQHTALVADGAGAAGARVVAGFRVRVKGECRAHNAK